MRTAIPRAFLRADPLGHSCGSNAARPPRSRSRPRRGFSIAEILVVMIIAGLVMKMALPRFAAMRDRMAVRAAKQQIGAYLVTARATAIRRSRASKFKIQNNTIWATTIKSDGTDSTIAFNVPLLTARGVTVTADGSAANESISFDSRGMALSLANARTYVLTRNSSKDSICISRLGLIARRCGQ
jgi:prepilin-type N-terminal cleavage/methylation domain-containing protein